MGKRIGEYKLGNSMSKNKFCDKKNLKTESDVEQFFVIKMLSDLGYSSDYIKTKTTISEYSLGKKTRRKKYSPDYIIYIDKKHKKPVIIVDAKSPNKSAEEGVLDSQLYVSVIRRKMEGPKVEQYCIGINGRILILRRFDSNKNILTLNFEDFVDGNKKYERLKEIISYDSISKKQFSLLNNGFKFEKPNLSEIRGIFQACHNTIWRKEVMSPESAFYEFAKLMFVKLHEDKRLHNNPKLKKLIDNGEPLPIDKVYFSVQWIKNNEDAESDPINSILFRGLCKNLEWEIKKKKKKRIFEKGENIDLEPDTIKEIVQFIQHFDLISIDEDLNGRLFETFLSATMRGKELGQFFTPRGVVDFMTKMADIQVSDKKIDYILDACCGTGGFLIEAMALMIENIKKAPHNRLLAKHQKEIIIKKIRDQHLFGIDAGKKPPIARIARINMYLHGDGGSKIYFADSLDKELKVSKTIPLELREEREELKHLLSDGNLKFDLVLTNPPFAMRYKKKVKDQERILRQYKLAINKDGKLKASLKSNVMFLERYGNLLKPGGKLITVIDESVLNTDSGRPVRNLIFKNFYIRAVISLPRWAFFQAGSNVKTSILYLIKKEDKTDEQPYTFYARSENIGFNKMKPDSSKSDLTEILFNFKKFTKTGRIKNTTTNWRRNSKFFMKKLSDNMRRIDFEYLDPRHEKMLNEVKAIEKTTGYKVEPLSRLCKLFTGKSSKQYVSEGVPIIKSKDIKEDGIDWDTNYVLKTFFEKNITRRLIKNDILLNTTGVGTLGRVALFDKNILCMTDGHITTLRINDKTVIIPDYLVYYLQSAFGKTQIERYTVGSTGQTELNDSDIAKILIIYPEDIKEQKAMIKNSKNYELKAIKAKKNYSKYLKKRDEEFVKHFE